MALWNGLAQAATVAQLVGVDAGGLISMTVQAVQTVRRNREECRQLVRRVMMIGDLLQQLQGSEMMQRPETRRPLDGLVDALQQAYMLVTSCQGSNIMYRFFMAGNQAHQFHDVQNRIDSYLLLFPFVGYIDMTRRLDQIFRSTHPPGSQPQAAEEILGSFSSHSNPGSRTEASVFDDIESVGVPAATDPEQDDNSFDNFNGQGHGGAEVLPDRRHRFRWFVWWTRRERTRSIHRLIDHGGTGFTVFNFSQLAASTNNFSYENRLGAGSYGYVYKGQLPNDLDVAIKINREDTTGRPDFENEIRIISKLQHENIIKLLGCCIEGNKKILVYEYMPNRSLDYLIERTYVSINWPIWSRIIKGIAQGAVYLHQHSRLRVIHGDLKPHNVVLDLDITPRITDFGIAEVLSSGEDEKVKDHVSGTLGYVDPEYLSSCIISTRSDLYAFGVTLLGIITSQRACTSFPERRLLVVYREIPGSIITVMEQKFINTVLDGETIKQAWELWSTGRAMELIHPSLHDEPGLSDILRCVQIALLCVQNHGADRPTMSDVLLMLSCGSIALPVPNPPMQRANEDAAPN